MPASRLVRTDAIHSIDHLPPEFSCHVTVPSRAWSSNTTSACRGLYAGVYFVPSLTKRIRLPERSLHTSGSAHKTTRIDFHRYLRTAGGVSV